MSVKKIGKIRRLLAFILISILLLTELKPILASDTEVNIVSSYSEFVKADEVLRDATTRYMIVYKSGKYYYALHNNGGYIGTTLISDFVMSDGTLRVMDKDLYSWIYEPIDGDNTYGTLTSVNDSKVIRIDKSTGLMLAEKDTTAWSGIVKVEQSGNGFIIKTRNSGQSNANAVYCYLKFNTSDNIFTAGMGTDETASNLYDELLIYEMVSEGSADIEPSSSKIETYILGEDSYKAYSDKGTTNIESTVSTVTGQVDVDKSVAYKEDVYNSGYTYSDGEFSVILSALSDQYLEAKNKIPDLDVVFILDISGSMQFYGRMSKTIAALNEAMKEIIAVNPDNRVGMITFSSIRADGSGGNNGIHGCEFLPLSAYDSISLSFEGNDNLGKGESAQAGATITVKGVNGRSTSSKTMNVYGATYTQYGIYLAYEMLNSATDKEGRIPIVILLTDGEPTVYTRSYNDVGNTNASVIGDLGSGHSTTGEYQGYYTVLSASYYKEKIAGLYTDENGQNLSREDVRFYNIGIDLANDTGNTSCSHFRKMIVSPSLETLDDVISCNHTRHETYYKELCTLLNDNQSLWYEYCDKYENMDNLTLREGIEAFIKMMVAQEINIIANPLEAGTNITFIDNIGEGMELKEAPILRYNGLNYTVSSKSVSDNVTTYTYSGSVNVSGKSNGDKVELSLMEVKVISNTDGTTTVEWIIPVELVPLMLRSSATEVLYDILPMRLIMRVGPNATGEAILEEGVPIYTNNWNAGSETKVIYTPSAVNVYYASNYQEIVNKDEMVSKTSATYYSASNSEGTVTALLGNNGKLVNISKYTLPATGGNGVNIYYFVGLLTIILCFTYMVLYNKSKANNCGKEMK